MPYQEKASVEDCYQLGPDLREIDLLEVELMGLGVSPTEALLEGVEKGVAHSIFSDDHVILSMYGVAPMGLPGVGVPWMLSSDAFIRDKEAKRRVFRESPEAIIKMHRLYPVLTNFISVENKLPIRWLKWLGFSFYPCTPALLHFTRKAASCA